jgi:arylformamidase
VAGPARSWLSLEYDNRTRVPEHPAILAGWAKQSAVVRASIACRLDLPYGPSLRQRLDIFPARHGIGAALLFIHGGYWRALDKADFSFLAPGLVDAGVSLIVVAYDLCPKVGIEEIVRQMLLASAWIYRHAHKYAIDPERLFVAGHSAGGHLAAMLMAAQWPLYEQRLPPNLFKGALSVSGLHDLRPLVNVDFLREDLRLDESSPATLSPAFLPPATRAPVYTCVGGEESAEYRRQTALLRSAWSAVAGVDIAMPAANHFTVLEALAQPNTPLFAGALRLIESVRR